MKRVKNGHLIYSQILEQESFFSSDINKEITINSLFQVWKKGNGKGIFSDYDVSDYVDIYTVCASPDRLCGLKKIGLFDFYLSSSFYGDSLKIVYDIFDEINEVNTRLDNVILLRSTVTPGTTRKIKEKYPLLNIVFNPEFLTERSAKFDFINQSRFVLGGSMGYTERVADLYRWRFGTSIPVLETTYETAELIKYMNNTFFATKVSFMNEMRLVSDKIGANWDEAVDGFVLDGRVGHSHLNVPGPDGKFGFGGSCFPKDIQAMIHFMDTLGIHSNVLTGAWETNLDVRPEEDWKELKGRAVTNE